MQETQIADVIEKEKDQSIIFQSDEMIVIQMSAEYIKEGSI